MIQPLGDEPNGFGESGSAEAEGALDKACLAADVACDVESAGLAFAQCPHHLKALDRRVGCFQRLGAADRTDQLLQLAVVGLDTLSRDLT